VSSTVRQESVYRSLPLNGREEFQECKVLEPADVPPLSDDAVVANRTIRSVCYQDGLKVWWVDRFDKSIIRAYRENRDPKDVEAGAFPYASRYKDSKGPL
jgi:hypothetical protein